MQKYNSFLEIRDLKGPGLGLLQLVLFCFGGMIVFQIISVLPLMLLFNTGFEETMRLMTDMGDPRSKVALYTTQAVGSLGAFILVPLLYVKLYQSTKVSTYFSVDTRYWQPLTYAILITFCFMVVNSLFIEWNINLKFPEFMSGFEQWAQTNEEQRKVITEYLTDFSGFGELLVALFVVAIIPGIGEELLFRGLIQTRLQQLVRNPHAAIWISALFFSAFHVQFYGFVPRLFLGALFGYIFYWSGSLVLAMLAHFFNNGFSLVMLYLYKNDLVDFNIDDTETVPLETVGFFFIIGAALTYLFIKFHRNLENADG
ncbi:CPBP family intramembrane glutamic endopeptidase [Imperialibacter roseus]|uniref:CPBP family intramembrane glutamic endopeptidase n=1 Tax=Imperialibacter roseus TaxID=1324217 RepID=A0ABZ0IPJ1_9BACT|nr:CPBP family intramembrane glutamic endopeptidase [Imperialibacter roseus]WOK06491.1 CPBP family intramembrane glutamic endopeptidase [Imperialibacter roseus]